MTAVFSKIAIESVKKQDIPQSLAKRQELSIDPFGQGYDTMTSKTDMAAIELNQIRLCFQVFIPGDQDQYVARPIAVSNLIKDKRVNEDLSIINISKNSAPVNGGKKILLFTSKICKDNIQVRFSCNYSKLQQNFIILVLFISFSSYEPPIRIPNFYNKFFVYLLFEYFYQIKVFDINS